MSVAVSCAHILIEPIGRIVSHIQEERTLPGLPQKVNRVIRDSVQIVPMLMVNFAVPDGLVTVEAACVTPRLGKPITKTQLRMKTVSKMPLAAHSTVVSCLGQYIRQCGEFLDRAIGINSHLSIRLLGAKPVMHAMLRRHQAGQQRGAVRRTHRICAKSVREPQAVTSQLVNVWREDFFIPVAPQGPRALVVGDDENNIGLHFFPF